MVYVGQVHGVVDGEAGIVALWQGTAHRMTRVLAGSNDTNIRLQVDQAVTEFDTVQSLSEFQSNFAAQMDDNVAAIPKEGSARRILVAHVDFADLPGMPQPINEQSVYFVLFSLSSSGN